MSMDMGRDIPVRVYMSKCPCQEVRDIPGEHRLQLSWNLRDSPGFLVAVLRTGRLYYNCIAGPG